MKKQNAYILYGISLLVLYILNIFFALHRVKIPNDSGFVQTEIKFHIQELASGNVYAYVLAILNILAIFSIIFLLIKFVKSLVIKLRKCK